MCFDGKRQKLWAPASMLRQEQMCSELAGHRGHGRFDFRIRRFRNHVQVCSQVCMCVRVVLVDVTALIRRFLLQYCCAWVARCR
jgi:hypothetical protein